MSDDKNYVKIRTKLNGRFRVLEHEDEAPVLYSGTDSHSNNHEDFKRNSSFTEQTNQFLINLDNKLNTILAVLKKDDVDKRFASSANIVEISGGGVTIATTENLRAGTSIEIMIFLEDFPPRTVSAIGKVKASKQLAQGFIHAVEFTNITDVDQTQIMQYIFQIERRTLRSKNL
ncbi:PilZ domain-containing protein [Desulfovibrio litoralis]|uniref:PilZ domain-containing protein n=1 Tax=Desulfovibrio litoralis DSM 11393 TaxID=1121455 RepID=A0A1M7THV3_9BACT|nr:PilZ domain-containing protein [Desulfovibrio litoralis]SHN70307.1 PilZ domain-containing protein [Desulfovibrio litoralis DSM 11393]